MCEETNMLKVKVSYPSSVLARRVSQHAGRDRQRQLYLVKNCFILRIDLGSGSAAPSAPYDLVSSLLDPKHGVSNIRITSQNTHIALSWPSIADRSGYRSTRAQ
jgi:hypothetical protein